MRLHVDIEKDLRDFRLKVAFDTDSEVFALLGASGSGKSMTLRCIAGIEKPDRGSITLGEKVLFDSASGTDLPPQERKVGYLFQDYALFPHMTVLENVRCGSAGRAEEYIEKFCLRGKENLIPAQLSGGEKQRTALARMLAADPRLIMLDEPLSSLDSHLKTAMEAELTAAIACCGGQAVLVSHDREEIYRLADRAGVMDGGRLSCVQSKKEMFLRPASSAAAKLTGWENVIPCDRGEESHIAFRAKDVIISSSPPGEEHNRSLFFLCHAPAGSANVMEDLTGYIVSVSRGGEGNIICRTAERPDTKKEMWLYVPEERIRRFAY